MGVMILQELFAELADLSPGCPVGERVDRPRAVHGGCVQQRAAGHRREHPAGCGFLQQGEVCLRQGWAWKSGRLGSLGSWSAPNCPQAVGLCVPAESSKRKGDVLSFLTSYGDGRVIYDPESFRCPWNLWALVAKRSRVIRL